MAYSDLSMLVENCSRDFADTEGADMNMELHIAENIQTTFNPTLISSVILNLLQNAVKYGRKNGQILVTLEKDDHSIYLSVTDDGIGIAPNDLNKVWNRFWQADTSRGENGGSGLGLALVKEIISFHGGTVNLSSVVNQGSTFTITLPYRKSIE